MSFCTRCGQSLAGQTNFCGHCGAQIPAASASSSATAWRKFILLSLEARRRSGHHSVGGVTAYIIVARQVTEDQQFLASSVP